MLHQVLYAPFAEAARQRLYDEVLAALRADVNGPATLLLGNFAVAEGGAALDAVVVRPHSITLLQLVPRGGRLRIPSLTFGAWKLDEQALTGIGSADNPFEQFRAQQQALAEWLRPQLSPEQANLQFISGLVVFGGPVTFSPDVEEQLSQQPGGHFQLLADAQQLPRRLRQLARPEIDLTEADIAQWAQDLAETPAEAPAATATAPAAASPVADGAFPNVWSRLWRWLGAEDVTDDTAYGYSPQQIQASNAEKQRLEEAQRQAQAELRQQLRALEAREEERERSMATLRAQLAQAPPVTAEADALRERLSQESREKAALEEAIQASRAEAAARNRELDAKIDQLTHLIGQLSTGAAASAGAGPLPPTAPVLPGGSPLRAPAGGIGTRRPAWRRRLPRLAAVAGLAAMLGLGGWGLGRLSSNSLPSAAPGDATVTESPTATASASPTPDAEQPPAAEEGEAEADASEEPAAPAPSPADPYAARFPYADGYARVQKKDGAFTFIDEDGQEFGRSFAEARDFSEGYAAVHDQLGWHYITGPQEEDPDTPPFVFLEAYSFREGLARVRLKPGYTYITKVNLAGQGPSAFQLYEEATDFENGRAQVTLQGRRFTIDETGQPVE